MRRILLALSVSFLLLVSIVAASAVGAAFPGDEIAFQLRGDCCFEIHVLDLRTSVQSRIAANGFAPAWSPDGTHIAFIQEDSPHDGGQFHLCVAEADGVNLRCTADIRGYRMTSPSWSPDGSRIALNVCGQGVVALDAHALDQPPVLLKPDLAAVFTTVAWLPDGAHIAYTVAREGGPHLYRVHLETGDTRRLMQQAGSPAWSPDGERIAYVFRRQIVLADGHETPDYVTAGTDPAWSPDGQWLAFARGDASRSDLMLRHLASGREITLVSNERLNLAPSWRPR